jgi:hypothetical protein
MKNMGIICLSQKNIIIHLLYNWTCASDEKIYYSAKVLMSILPTNASVNELSAKKVQ